MCLNTKTDVGIYPLFVIPQLLYIVIFFRHLHIFIDAFQKLYHNPTGFVKLSPENFDNINVSGESVIFGG